MSDEPLIWIVFRRIKYGKDANPGNSICKNIPGFDNRHFSPNGIGSTFEKLKPDSNKSYLLQFSI